MMGSVQADRIGSGNVSPYPPTGVLATGIVSAFTTTMPAGSCSSIMLPDGSNRNV